jgi:hypothetical protein
LDIGHICTGAARADQVTSGVKGTVAVVVIQQRFGVFAGL